MKSAAKILLAIASVCFLIACSKSNDDPVVASKQLKSEVTRSYAYKWEVGWYCDVFCDGQKIDYLEGSGYGQVVDHYKNGIWQWEFLSFKGIGTNLAGDTLTFSEQDKYYTKKLQNVQTCHTNLKGDKGTLYNISFIFTFDQDWIMTSWQVKNATCTANSAY